MTTFEQRKVVVKVTERVDMRLALRISKEVDDARRDGFKLFSVELTFERPVAAPVRTHTEGS